jgi:flagellar biosynthetic protein FliR
MTDLSISVPWALGLALAVTRAAALISMTSLISRSLPGMARSVIAIAFALVIAEPIATLDASAADLMALTVMNLLLGGILGWFLGLFVSMFPVAGSLVDATSGVTLGSVFDPDAGTTPGPFTLFYQLGGQTLIVVLGGFTVVVQVLWASTQVIPLDGALGSLSSLGAASTDAVSSMFQRGVELAMPVIAVLFVAEMAFGLLSRLAPGVNMFLIALPLKTLMVVSMIGSAAVLFPRFADQALASGIDTVERLLGG